MHRATIQNRQSRRFYEVCLSLLFMFAVVQSSVGTGAYGAVVQMTEHELSQIRGAITGYPCKACVQGDRCDPGPVPCDSAPPCAQTVHPCGGATCDSHGSAGPCTYSAPWYNSSCVGPGPADWFCIDLGTSSCIQIQPRICQTYWYVEGDGLCARCDAVPNGPTTPYGQRTVCDNL